MRYLSPEWFAAAQLAIGADDQLRDRVAQLELTIEQTVTDGPDDDKSSGPVASGAEAGSGSGSGSTIRWHVILDHGTARLLLGPAPEADLRFRAPYPVACAIAEGRLAAQVAFIQGDLQVGGDLSLLTTHHRTLAALDDVLVEVRRATTFA